MSTERVNRIVADTARKHREELNEEDVCICGWTAHQQFDYPAHLAYRIRVALESEGIHYIANGELS